MKRIAVIGEGAWGTAMSCVLADAGHEVNLWAHDQQTAHEINEKHTNSRYAPGFKLPTSITAQTDISQTLANASHAFVSTPLPYLRTVVHSCQPYNRTDLVWVCLSKGLEQNTLMLPSHIVQDVLGQHIQTAVLSGPSFAKEVLEKKLTAVIVASDTAGLTNNVMHLVTGPYFRTCASDDVIGVQLGGALKNAICVLLGLAQGHGYADNTIALIFTRAWQEMHMLARALGAREDTLSDLSGIGDLMLTYTGHHSRNVAIGRLIGKSADARHAMAQQHAATCEGLNTIVAIVQMAQKHNLTLPVFTGLHAILFENQSIDGLVNKLAGL